MFPPTQYCPRTMTNSVLAVHHQYAYVDLIFFFPIICRSAIKALRPGGSLVYSTCTLSKAENSDVINLILNSCSNVMPVDISEMAKAVSREFSFLSGTQQHELLVLPEKGRAWGPMYIAKLKKM